MRPDMSVTEDYKRGYADCEKRYQSIDDVRDKRIRELEMMLGTEQTMHKAWRKRAEECELAGSAETGGEKAAWISVEERMPEDDDTSVWVCFENGSHYCSARWSDDQWWGYNLETEDTFEIEQQITHWMPLDVLPTFRRSSQNQAVSSGVEGAHEGTTADKSGEPEKLWCPECCTESGKTEYGDCTNGFHKEPEKLNNAQTWPPTITLSHGAPPAGSTRIGALAESSLSHHSKYGNNILDSPNGGAS